MNSMFLSQHYFKLSKVVPLCYLFFISPVFGAMKLQLFYMFVNIQIFPVLSIIHIFTSFLGFKFCLVCSALLFNAIFVRSF